MKTNFSSVGTLQEHELQNKVAALEPEWQELWREKYEFNKSTLGLNEQKAQDAAFRTVWAFQQVSTT